MKKIKIFGLFFTFCLIFFSNSIQASLTELSIAELSSNIGVVHNPNVEEFEKIIPLYQKYYGKRENKSSEEILEGYKELIKLQGFNFIAAFDILTNEYLGFINFGHAPDQFQSPKFLYRTVLDSAYVEDKKKELEVYNVMFDVAEKMSREIKSHRIVAKTGSSDFEQEKRLFSSNMNDFPCPTKEKIFFERYLDKPKK